MTDEAQWRRVALASYGTLTLQGNAEMAEWQRSRLFWEVRFQFRDGDSNALLAHDFPDWLAWHRARGATRLTLALLPSRLCCAAPVNGWQDCGLIVHLPGGQLEGWALGDEVEARPVTLSISPIWQIGRRAGDTDLDSYWRVALPPGWAPAGVAAVATPWPALWARIQRDLFSEGHRAGAHLPKPALCFAHAPEEGAEWSHWPVLPAVPALPEAHRLLNFLSAEQGQFGNDTHCKNEGSLYAMASAASAAQITAWGLRLDHWLLEVQLRAANDGCWRGEGGASAGPWSTLVTQLDGPLPDEVALTPDAGEAAASPVAHMTPSPPASRRGIWPRRWGALLAWVALATLVYALARIIIGWPWLALIFGGLVFLWWTQRGP